MSGHHGACVHLPVAEVTGIEQEAANPLCLGEIPVAAQRNRRSSATLLFAQVKDTPLLAKCRVLIQNVDISSFSIDGH